MDNERTALPYAAVRRMRLGDADGLVVDLNFAYQPSCAYDEAWACPLPGPGNTLAAEVPVGELFATTPS